jgi:undecaprenyl diphosphate synthase
MSKSIRDTVIQYCQPLRPRLKRPFSETHIARNIRAQRLSLSGEKPELQPPTQSAGQLTVEHITEDDYVYKPNLPESQQAFAKILKLVSRLLSEAADERTLTADDVVIAGATNSILYHLKDESITEEDKQAEVSDVVGVDVPSASLQELQRLADKLVDYAAADEQTVASESTTLSGGEHSLTQQIQQPAVKYPDAERITVETLNSNTYTGADTPPLDILVRTSGVERLSDFMLWQCHQNTDVSFVDCFWPDFGLKHLVPIILEWQWRRRKESVQHSYWKETEMPEASGSDWRKLD